MLLVAGAAGGLWLLRPQLERSSWNELESYVTVAIALLGGVSLAGAPMLLVDRILQRRRWRSGALLWFGLSAAAWGLAPAIMLVRLKVATRGGVADTCFIYTLPIMGLFLLSASLVGGRPVRRWWTCRGWWPEWFGMWVLVGWSVTGVYVLYSIYEELF